MKTSGYWNMGAEFDPKLQELANFMDLQIKKMKKILNKIQNGQNK